MRNFQFTRALALLLSLVLILSCLGSLRLPSAADEPVPDAVVVACSDFQNFEDSNGGGYTGSYTNNLALVNGILDAMDYPAIDGFVCGGDYNFTETMNSVSQTQTGIAALHDAVAARYPELPDERIVMVQGNHDAAGTPGMAVTGPYEADAYSLYVINEDDYMDRNTDEARIKATADKLAAWLSEKAAAEYSRPIFVATHLPLHFTTRTQKNGDGQYAHYLFDVLNEYGEQLNIIFLFGHNHAFGYDSYMGASSVLLQRGWFKYTKRKYGEGRRIFKMSPLHHHYQKEGIPALIQSPAHAIPEAKIVTRFWIVGIILAVATLALLKLR